MQRLLTVLLMFVAANFTVQGKEIAYYNKSWNQINEKAKTENKYIFVDCYTDWCYYCKVMDKGTMKDPKIVDALNKNFVSVKLNMEEGEGMKLCKKYHVQVFPTFLIFNPKGELVYKTIGSQSVDDFASTLNDARDKTKQFKSPGYSRTLDTKYPEFYDKLYAGNGKRTIPKEEEVNEFLAQQSDLSNEVSWAVIASCGSIDKKYVDVVFQKIEYYRSKYGAPNVDNFVQKVSEKQLKEAIKHKSVAEMELAAMTFLNNNSQKDEFLPFQYRITYFKSIEDWGNMIQPLSTYIAKKGFSEGAYINSICWDMNEKKAESKYLVIAAQWMSKVCELDPQYAYMDTYAAVLYGAGDVGNALKTAEKAIELGKNEGADTKSTEELLTIIKEKK